MKIPEHKLLPLLRHYAMGNAGDLLPGLVHNMNNYLQVLDMQLELISRRGAAALQEGSDNQGRLDRLVKSVDGLTSQMKCADKRMFYCGEEQTQINLSEYLSWMKEFWSNNLFFKHHLQLEIVVQQDIPSLELPPLYLTMCLEEPLKNAVEACQAGGTGANAMPLSLKVMNHLQGAAFHLFSPTSLSPDIQPWDFGTTTKPGHLGLGLALVRHFAVQLGWSVDLKPHENQLEFVLAIPSVRTLSPDADLL